MHTVAFRTDGHKSSFTSNGLFGVGLWVLDSTTSSASPGNHRHLLVERLMSMMLSILDGDPLFGFHTYRTVHVGGPSAGDFCTLHCFAY